MNTLAGIIEDINKSELVSDSVIKEVIKLIGQDKWNELQNTVSDICTTPGELLITLKEAQQIEENALEGWYIAYRDKNDKLRYYSGCKMGSGFVNGIYSAKIYKSKDNAIKTIVDKNKSGKPEWLGAFPLYVQILFP